VQDETGVDFSYGNHGFVEKAVEGAVPASMIEETDAESRFCFVEKAVEGAVPASMIEETDAESLRALH
jgi:hypothetical protein